MPEPEACQPDAADDDAATADEDRTLMRQLLRGDDAPDAVDDDFADDEGGTGTAAPHAPRTPSTEPAASIDEQIDSELSGVQRYALAFYEARQQHDTADDDD